MSAKCRQTGETKNPASPYKYKHCGIFLCDPCRNNKLLFGNVLLCTFVQAYARARANLLSIIAHYSTIRSAKCRHACICHKIVVPLHRIKEKYVFRGIILFGVPAQGCAGIFLSFCWRQQNDHIVGVSKMVQGLFVSFRVLFCYNVRTRANWARVRSLKTQCVGHLLQHMPFA